MISNHEYNIQITTDKDRSHSISLDVKSTVKYGW